MDDHDVFGDISRMHQKQITIHAGDEGLAETGRILYVEPDWTTDDLLQAAGRRLELISTPKRMFNCNGMEVADVMMIEEREVIFFTQGGDYVAPLLMEGDGVDGSGSSSGLPAVVGAYKVCEFLGKGGFGEVRVGEHQLTGERTALKFLRKSAIADMGAAERTTTEIQCLTALKHPNIIRLVQHINSPQNVIMVFELAEGGDLYQFLCNAPGQRVDEEEGRAVFRQVSKIDVGHAHFRYEIVSGVGYAHNQHICHRDMKLDNVLLSRPGCLKEVKLADFGLSDFYRPGATMRTNCGSISYLAPEVFRGTSNAGPPLDVWSIGVILFALLCGRLPFEGSDMQGTNRPREAAIRRRIMECRYKPADSLSPEAKDMLRRVLKLDPNERASIPEIFNHSWLRFRNVTSLDHQSGRKDDHGGLRDAFQDGSGGGPACSSGGSPRLFAPRGSNSPRLTPLSPRGGTPPGAADCKAPASPRPSAPGSPRRTNVALDPLDPKGSDQWAQGGKESGMEDMAAEAAVAAEVARGGSGSAEIKRSSVRESGVQGRGGGSDDDGGGYDKKDERSNHSGTDSDDDEHTSRAGRGGRGRDFTVSTHPIRGPHNNARCTSPNSSTRETMIRMNSRLGLVHPARKTISGFGVASGLPSPVMGSSGVGAGGIGNATASSTGGGGVGGGGGTRIPGVFKSRTIDLSHHLLPSSAASPRGLPRASPHASPQSLSPTQHQRAGTVRQRSWQSGGRNSVDRSPREQDHGRHVKANYDEINEGTGDDSLPPLSPRSSVEADHERGSGHYRNRGGRTPTPGKSSGSSNDLERNEFDKNRDGRIEERKNVRASSGSSICSSQRNSGSSRPSTSPPETAEERKRAGSDSAGGWGGWADCERAKETVRNDNNRLPTSPRDALPKEILRGASDGEEGLGKIKRPSSPRSILAEALPGVLGGRGGRRSPPTSRVDDAGESHNKSMVHAAQEDRGCAKSSWSEGSRGQPPSMRQYQSQHAELEGDTDGGEQPAIDREDRGRVQLDDEERRVATENPFHGSANSSDGKYAR